MMRYAILVLALVVSPGCYGLKSEDTGEWGNDNDNDDSEDEDSAQDTDEVEDTNEEDAPTLDGTYSGDLSVDMEFVGLVLTCEGQVDFEIADGALDGTMQCEFSQDDGLASSMGLTDVYEGDITGEVEATGNASGEISIDIVVEGAADWTGEMVGEDRLDGELSGEIPLFESDSATLNGTFTAEKE